MPRQRPRRHHDGAALVATRAEAWVSVVGSVIAVVGGILLVVGFLTRGTGDGLGGLIIGGFILLAIGVVLVEVVLMVMRRRRSNHFPSVIEYILATRPKRRRKLDRRIARFRTFFAAVKFLRRGSATSPPPSSDRSRDQRQGAPEAPSPTPSSRE